MTSEYDNVKPVGKWSIDRIRRMAGDFAKAGIRSAKDGFPRVPQNVYLERRKTCFECTKKKTCPFCGCILWLKCSMATERCPKGFWPAHETKDEAQVAKGAGVGVEGKEG